MYPTDPRSNSASRDFFSVFQPNIAFIAIILVALIAFELFNFSTTELALKDMLGTLSFLEMPWSTILTIAFCGIDFAGIARLFTPEHGDEEPKEVWYLFGAWLLAATMNAILTWWGVSIAVVSHPIARTEVVDEATIIKIVPVFVAILVWLIRILIIGTLSRAFDHLVHPGQSQPAAIENAIHASMNNPMHGMSSRPTPVSSPFTSSAIPQRPAPRRTAPAGRPSVGFSSDDENEGTNGYSINHMQPDKSNSGSGRATPGNPRF
jgi:hypothetical protein